MIDYEAESPDESAKRIQNPRNCYQGPDSGGRGDNGMKPHYFQVGVRNFSVVIEFYF